MAIGEQDKVRARHHLGYINAQSQATFVLGIPAAVQTQFVAEGAFNKILPSAEPLFLSLLDRMDAVECQIFGNTENLAADKVGEIELRKDEFAQLIVRYKHWQGAIGNMLGVPPNPFDARPLLGSGYNGGGGMNVRVHH